MTAKLLFVHALSSLHPGTGQSAGVIDLPIAREVATGIPYLPGSSLKGVLRDHCSADERKDLFGPELAGPNSAGSDVNSHAGAAVFTDQRLLLLPVRSLAGTFAWVTSPFVLQRFRRDCLNLGLPGLPTDAIPAGELTQARVTGTSLLRVGQGDARKVYLEDLDLSYSVAGSANSWADWLKPRLFPAPNGQPNEWQDAFVKRFCIVHDDVFSFLLATAMEILARNQLTDAKTSGNLWYEEALPAESILYGLVYGQKIGKTGKDPAAVLTAIKDLTPGTVQLGGNATIGRGLCRLVMEA
jgi:CRISPR-associated protein Cmr4